MPKKRLPPNAKCPCQSGKAYRRCCWNKGFEWQVDEKGNAFKAIPIPREMVDFLKEEAKWFEQCFGRKPGRGDYLAFSRLRSEYVQRETTKMLMESGASPEYVYAYQKTGLLLNSGNIKFLPDKDILEWNAAIKEFKQLKKHLKSKQPEPTLRDFEPRLDFCLNSCIRILGKVIHEYGIARNMKSRKKVHVYTDFLFLCYTKSLKTLRALHLLSERGFGEDALNLTRSLFETYITIAYLMKDPVRINALVVAQIRFNSGLSEKVYEDRAKGKRKVYRDKETGETFPINISAWERACGSYEALDSKIYTFLYDYLSDFEHSSIYTIENYVDSGCYFDDGTNKKYFHALLYPTFSALLLFESLLIYKKLKSQFRRDIAYFTHHTASFLTEVFSEMSHDGEHDVIGDFKKRLQEVCNRCAIWLPKRNRRREV